MRSMSFRAMTLVFVLVMFGGCSDGAVRQTLEQSTAPLLVPEGVWRDAFEFTAPVGSVDLYQVRWTSADGPDTDDAVTGWQIASSTTYETAAIAEGPGEEVVVEVLKASRGDDCELVDSRLFMQLCAYQDDAAANGLNTYLVRLVQDHILVVDYVNRDGDRTVYNPAAVEARFITAPFELVPIEGDIDDYLIND